MSGIQNHNVRSNYKITTKLVEDQEVPENLILSNALHVVTFLYFLVAYVLYVNTYISTLLARKVRKRTINFYNALSQVKPSKLM